MVDEIDCYSHEFEKYKIAIYISKLEPIKDDTIKINLAIPHLKKSPLSESIKYSERSKKFILKQLSITRQNEILRKFIIDCGLLSVLYVHRNKEITFANAIINCHELNPSTGNPELITSIKLTSKDIINLINNNGIYVPNDYKINQTNKLTTVKSFD